MVRWRWSGRDDEPDPADLPASLQRRNPRSAAASGAIPTLPAAGYGPYDIADTPRQAVRRIDLGSLLVPELPGVVYRFEVVGSADDQRVVAVVADADAVTMRLTVHAAPRGGLGDHVRGELLRSALAACLTAPQTASAAEGPFGPELWAALPAGEPGGAARCCRSLSVQGPRWLLLAVMTTSADAVSVVPGQSGAVSSAPDMAVLEDVLHATVVVRGERAMPAGAALALKLPTEPDLPDGDVDDRGDPDALADELGRLPPIGAITGDPRRVSYEVIASPAGGLSRNLTTWG